MTSAQVVETSVTNNSSFQNYSHPDDHTIRTTDTPGFKPFTKEMLIAMKICNIEVLQLSVKKCTYVIRFIIDGFDIRHLNSPSLYAL